MPQRNVHPGKTAFNCIICLNRYMLNVSKWKFVDPFRPVRTLLTIYITNARPNWGRGMGEKAQKSSAVLSLQSLFAVHFHVPSFRIKKCSLFSSDKGAALCWWIVGRMISMWDLNWSPVTQLRSGARHKRSFFEGGEERKEQIQWWNSEKWFFF